jgi:hypothetical protein
VCRCFVALKLSPEGCAVLLATHGAVLERGSVLISGFACARGLNAWRAVSPTRGCAAFLWFSATSAGASVVGRPVE